MSKVLWAALVHSPWDHAGDPDFWQTLQKNARALKESTDRALMIVCGCNLFEWGTFLRRMDNFLMDLVLNQKEVERLLDALMEQHLATLEKVCQAVGDIADVLRFGDDLGMDNGPFMQPKIYRQLFKPRHTILRSGLSCGARAIVSTRTSIAAAWLVLPDRKAALAYQRHTLSVSPFH